jgi:hypothetical protein
MLSSGSQNFLAQAEQLANGQPADFDGDGIPETIWTTDPDGSITIQTDANGDGVPEYLYRWDKPSATGYEIIDADSNGMPERRSDFTANPVQRVVLLDHDFNGKFERRLTETYDLTAHTIHAVTEIDPAESGTWAVDSDTTGPISRDGTDANGFYQCDPKPSPAGGGGGGPECDGLGDTGPAANNQTAWPPGDPTVTLGKFGHIGVFGSSQPTDGPNGECSQDHMSRILKALDCAIERNQHCLAQSNNGLSSLLDRFSAGGQWSIACGNRCPNIGATTGPELCPPWLPDFICPLSNPRDPTSPRDNPEWHGRTNLSQGTLDTTSDSELCMVLLHEWLHAAGADDTNTDDHNRCRSDSVYACGRYCPGCIESGARWGIPAGINAQYDCAACAGTPIAKLKCGLRDIERSTYCVDSAATGGYDQCADQNNQSAPCSVCLGPERYYCDGTLQRAVDGGECCLTCPADKPIMRYIACTPGATDGVADFDTCKPPTPSCPPQ